MVNMNIAAVMLAIGGLIQCDVPASWAPPSLPPPPPPPPTPTPPPPTSAPPPPTSAPPPPVSAPPPPTFAPPPPTSAPPPPTSAPMPPTSAPPPPPAAGVEQPQTQCELLVAPVDWERQCRLARARLRGTGQLRLGFLGSKGATVRLRVLTYGFRFGLQGFGSLSPPPAEILSSKENPQ